MVITEFAAGDPEATMHAMATEIPAPYVVWVEISAPRVVGKSQSQ
jgi:hypothetical protein